MGLFIDLMVIYFMEIGKKGNLFRGMLKRKLIFVKIDYNIVIMENSRMGYKMDSDIVDTMMEPFILGIGKKVLWKAKEYYGIRIGTNILAHLSSPKNQDLGMRKSRIPNILGIFRIIKIMGWVLNK